jgi:hypothetical protein
LGQQRFSYVRILLTDDERQYGEQTGPIDFPASIWGPQLGKGLHPERISQAAAHGWG